MSQSPCHFAFFVRDLQSTRDFYSGILDCPEGRSSIIDSSGNALEFKTFRNPENVFTV